MQPTVQSSGSFRTPADFGTHRLAVPRWVLTWRRTSEVRPVKNVDLWQRLDEAVSSSEHVIDWRWVKGHAGDPGNERADALANDGVTKALAQGR